MTILKQYVSIILLMSLFIGCEDNLDNSVLMPDYFDGFKMIETLNGQSNIELKADLTYTGGNFVGEGESNMSWWGGPGYSVDITLFDIYGQTFGSESGRVNPDNSNQTLTVSLYPLLQNKKYHYTVKLSNYPDDFYTIPEIYSFRTKKIPGINLVSDIEGNIYETVKIGTQEWFVQNLRSNRYATGKNTDMHVSAHKPNYKHPRFLGQIENPNYPFKVIQNVDNICPEGWHIPDVSEFEQLFNSLKDKHGTRYLDEANRSSTNKSYLSLNSEDYYWTTSMKNDTIPYVYGMEAHYYRDESGDVIYYEGKKELDVYDRQHCIRCIKDSSH